MQQILRALKHTYGLCARPRKKHALGWPQVGRTLRQCCTNTSATKLCLCTVHTPATHFSSHHLTTHHRSSLEEDERRVSQLFRGAAASGICLMQRSVGWQELAGVLLRGDALVLVLLDKRRLDPWLAAADACLPYALCGMDMGYAGGWSTAGRGRGELVGRQGLITQIHRQQCQLGVGGTSRTVTQLTPIVDPLPWPDLSMDHRPKCRALHPLSGVRCSGAGVSGEGPCRQRPIDQAHPRGPRLSTQGLWHR